MKDPPEVMKGCSLGAMKTNEMKGPEVMKGPEFMKGCSLGDMKMNEMKGPKVMKGHSLGGAMKTNEISHHR